MARLNCQFCERPVDSHAAILGSGRVCRRCIDSARGTPRTKRRQEPRLLKNRVNTSPRGTAYESTTYVKPAHCAGDTVVIQTPRGTITIRYEAGDGGRGWSIPSTIW